MEFLLQKEEKEVILSIAANRWLAAGVVGR